eukprot:TRINITY_DN9200_c2_g1_i1.p1 TRINITY_DN9200_c2_g1~~TRINITY_DN9200_c2_g1_i1.p1  ORF type:complete len:405 (+),score=19.83 TRINITY_DN9200_c2_g1_i1:364-1578(+)
MGFSHTASLLLLSSSFLLSFSFMAMADDPIKNPSNSSISSPPPPPPPPKPNLAPFRPSIAVIVGVLTTMFSITFLLLLYAKHCKRTSTGSALNPNSTYTPSGRRNSGIDRAVIDSLPVFRFGSLRGQKDGLECAVCLTRFDPTEVLRLLPKCKHAFHVECVDTWLDAHSTCPLCRYRVDPEDVLLVDDSEPISKPGVEEEEKESKSENRTRFGSPVEYVFHRISGRHSSAGEDSTTGFLRLPDPETRELPIRRSVDGSSSLRKNQSDSVRVGCLDRSGSRDPDPVPEPDRKRFEHRIIVSDAETLPRRWSDFRPSDLLFLRSEMIITDSCRFSLSSLKQPPHLQQRQDVRLQVAEDDIDGSSGRSVITSRCVSEITGLSRFRRDEGEKAVNRWLGFAGNRMERR